MIHGFACSLQGASAGIRAQADAYRDVRDNLSEGLRFYMSLQEAIVTLQQQIGDFCLTRRIQRCGEDRGSSSGCLLPAPHSVVTRLIQKPWPRVDSRHPRKTHSACSAAAIMQCHDSRAEA